MKTIIDDIGSSDANSCEKKSWIEKIDDIFSDVRFSWRKGLKTGFSHSQNCWLVPKVKRLTTYVVMPDGSQFSLSGCTLHQANEEMYLFAPLCAQTWCTSYALLC